MELSTRTPHALAGAAAVRRPGPPLRLYGGTLEALAAPVGGRLIITPNLDHLRLLTLSKALRRAYRSADVLLNDSRFLDRAFYQGRAFCLTGADLAPQLLQRLPHRAKVFVIGYTPEVEQALRARYRDLAFEFHEPSMGYIRRPSERRRIVARAMMACPDLVLVCTGAPQSELLAAQLKRAGCRADMLCCGSGLLFLAGVSKRAPQWTQRLGGEWLWRFLNEPRTRKRYTLDALFLARNLPGFLGVRKVGSGSFAGYRLSCA
jgi:N-acetylglucosaminyldiphosphoundecaprenol N-acetyl-beta-D-mannosaminyltransferase